MLNVHHLSFSYDTLPILNDISFSVEKGQIVCLVGASGGGKSTLLRLISGLETVQQGEVHLGGEMASGADTHIPAEKRGVGLVFQHPSLFPHLSVLENVMFGLKSMPKKVAIDIGKDLLEGVEFHGDVNAYPHMLSGGQHQRVALARALAPAPAVLLMDEPFANLDSQLRARVRDDVFTLLKRRKTTTIMVTHDPAEALQIADCIHLLGSDGSLLQSGTPDEIYHRPNDEATAHFFGMANIFTPATLKSTLNISSDKTGLLRPEQLTICDDADTKGSITATVSARTFSGMYHVITADCGDVTLRLCDTEHRPLSIGDKIHIAFDPEAVHYF